MGEKELYFCTVFMSKHKKQVRQEAVKVLQRHLNYFYKLGYKQFMASVSTYNYIAIWLTAKDGEGRDIYLTLRLDLDKLDVEFETELNIDKRVCVNRTLKGFDLRDSSGQPMQLLYTRKLKAKHILIGYAR
jgi:hypothetical protein